MSREQFGSGDATLLRGFHSSDAHVLLIVSVESFHFEPTLGMLFTSFIYPSGRMGGMYINLANNGLWRAETAEP